jgi:hypothetical protein
MIHNEFEDLYESASSESYIADGEYERISKKPEQVWHEFVVGEYRETSQISVIDMLGKLS